MSHTKFTIIYVFPGSKLTRLLIVSISLTKALDAESEHMVQEAIDHMLAEGRGKDGNPGEST